MGCGCGQNSGEAKQKYEYRCSYCQVAFNTYGAAVQHEAICPQRPGAQTTSAAPAQATNPNMAYNGNGNAQQGVALSRGAEVSCAHAVLHVCGICNAYPSQKKQGVVNAQPVNGIIVAQPVTPSNVQYIPGKPVQMPMGQPPKPVPVVAFQPTQAMQLEGQLLRMYLGLGWTNAGGKQGWKPTDIDASCIAFSGGKPVEAVWYGELHNAAHTLAHSGDILAGDAGGDDLERIYLWLERIDPKIDMLLLVANVFTPDVDFSSLSSAYVRIANADTNQELGRLWLGGQSFTKMTTGVNGIVFAKVYKHMGHWQTMVLGKPLTVPGCSNWESMMPQIQQSGLAIPPTFTPAPGKPAKPMQPQAPGQKVQKPSKVWPCAALAVGTAAGAAAAIAIFTATDMDERLFGVDLVEAGVDFGQLVASAFPDEMICDAVGQFGDWAGDACQATAEFAGEASAWTAQAASDSWGAISDSGVFEGTADFAGDAAGAVGDFAGDAAGAFGDVGGQVMDSGVVQRAGDQFGDAFGAIKGAIGGFDKDKIGGALGGLFG